MAKVYKVSLYITDHDNEYRDKEHLQANLKECLYDLWIGIDHLEIKESKEFEWNDDLVINKTNASKEDFEIYLQKDE